MKKLLMMIFMIFMVACTATSDPGQIDQEATQPVSTIENTQQPAETATDEATRVAATETATTSPERNPTDEPTIEAEATATASATPASDGVPDDEVTGEGYIKFHKTGGFAGVDQIWIIYRSGRVVMDDGGEFTLDVERNNRIWSHIDDGSFFALEGEYLPKNTCCDFFQYEITVVDEGRKHTVVTMDEAEMPPTLESLLMELQEVAAQQPSQ